MCGCLWFVQTQTSLLDHAGEVDIRTRRSVARLKILPQTDQIVSPSRVEEREGFVGLGEVPMREENDGSVPFLAQFEGDRSTAPLGAEA